MLHKKIFGFMGGNDIDYWVEKGTIVIDFLAYVKCGFQLSCENFQREKADRRQLYTGTGGNEEIIITDQCETRI